jgi:type II secretory pathway pseudopilin PulG
MIRRRHSPRSGSEQGYVLLVFALFAALLVVGIYRILPKYVFEGQRQKEEEMIFRAQQYTRAIQLFVRKLGRYPNSIDELENTNQIRYLRKRYMDPMTVEGDWRLIHIGPGGVFIDSKYPPIPTTGSTNVTTGGTSGGTSTGGTSGGNSPNQPAGNPFNLPRDNSGTTNPPQQQQPQQRQQAFGGGGIAGVASQSEAEAIKVINGYHHYNEWEFIFNYSTDKLAALKVTQTSGGSAQQPNQPGGQTQPNNLRPNIPQPRPNIPSPIPGGPGSRPF